MKNQFFLIVPTLLTLSIFVDVSEASATTDEPSSVVILYTDTQASTIESIVKSTILESISPEGIAPPFTSPETSPLENTTPEVVSPTTTSPETPPLENTTPEVVAPTTTSPETPPLENTTPEVVSPAATTSPETPPLENTTPEVVAPTTTSPETPPLENTTPEVVAPATTTPETTPLENTITEVVAPATTTPETTPLENTITEVVEPATTTPETTDLGIVLTMETEQQLFLKTDSSVIFNAVVTTPSELITKVDTDQQVISLTISDITDQSNLTAILTNLASLGVKATFFVDGTTNIDFIEQIFVAGHEIGNQSYQHVDTTQLSTTQLATEITQMDNIIVNSTGESSKPFFRAPYGITSADVLATAGTLGYNYTIGWTNEIPDWNGAMDADQLSATVINSLAPGTIYLFHANSLAASTPAALLSIVSSAKSMGYSFTTIGDLLVIGGIIEPEIPISNISQLINQVDIDQKVISLTFDDGDSDEHLSSILYTLNYLGVKATFFLNGTTDPDLMNQIITDGHQLANHTYSHLDSTTITTDKLVTELNTMEAYIQSTTGTSPLPFFRAPHGFYNDSVLETVGSLGYKYTVGWSIDTMDWTGNSKAEISNTVLQNIHPGAIVLMHASTLAANTPSSLWYTIAALREAGYTFATVEGLMTLGGYEWEVPVVTIPSELITKVDTDQQVISLTISDITDQSNLTAILTNLASLGVKATFFVDGTTNIDFIEQIFVAGHEIGNQSYQHVDTTQLSTTQLATEITQMDNIIVNSTGESSKPFFRAPYGITSADVLATAGTLGYNYTIGWTNEIPDWNGAMDADQLSATVINSLAPGTIYLFHANSLAASTPAALLSIVSSAKSMGYSFTTIGDLLVIGGIILEKATAEFSDFLPSTPL